MLTIELMDIIWIGLLICILVYYFYKIGYWNGQTDALKWATEMHSEINSLLRKK